MGEAKGSKSQNGKSSKNKKTSNNPGTEKPSRIVTKMEILNIIFEMVFQIIGVIGMHIICNEKQCSLTRLPDLSQLTSLSSIFNAEVFLYTTVFFTFSFVLLLLPIGGETVRVEDFTYNFRGFNGMMLIMLTVLLLETIGVPVSYYVDKHILHLATSLLIHQMLFGVYSYINSIINPHGKINPREVGTPFLSGFYHGRNIHSRFLNKLDLKFVLMDVIIFYAIAIDLALLLRGLNLTDSNGLNFNNLNWTSFSSQPTLLVLFILRFLYLISNVYYESRLLCSYYVNGEGFGYNTAVATPTRYIMLVAQMRFIKDHNIHYPNWQLFSILPIFLFALYVYNATNNQKYLLRANPNSPEVKKMKRIPTSTGKDILCDGWWGVLRQPNITADIILHLAMIRFGYHTPPVIISMMASVYYLVERARDSQKDCKKYGLAWKKYCEKVKYVLIPYVY